MVSRQRPPSARSSRSQAYSRSRSASALPWTQPWRAGSPAGVVYDGPITMPLRNRVTPLGELVADPARGLVYGNRGCLHDEHGTIRRRDAGKRWIGCRLEFRGRRRTRLLQPGRYTELFFLDEATAFAAGHRPCAECRREDYVRFQELWRGLGLRPANADAMDERLHAE